MVAALTAASALTHLGSTCTPTAAHLFSSVRPSGAGGWGHAAVVTAATAASDSAFPMPSALRAHKGHSTHVFKALRFIGYVSRYRAPLLSSPPPRVLALTACCGPARCLHLLLQPDAQQQFLEAKAAFETLSDAAKRSEYDRRLRAGFSSGSASGGWSSGGASAGSSWKQAGPTSQEPEYSFVSGSRVWPSLHSC